MRHITPTGHGKDGRARVQLLGSTAAVLEAIGPDGILVVANLERAHAAARIIGDTPGLERPMFSYIIATHGTEPFYRIPPETVIGVDVEAWAGVPLAMWEQVQSVIQSRFKTVHWG